MHPSHTSGSPKPNPRSSPQKPLQPVGTDRFAAGPKPPDRREILDELAACIAEENDTRARQRYDEVFNPQKYYSAEKKRAMNFGVWACLLLITLIVVFAFNCHR